MANNWTREQTIVALWVYCRIPFNKASNNNPEIVKAANSMGRSAVAVKMKVGNFDPNLKAKGIIGLSNTSKLDKEIWDEYSNDWEKLAFDSEQIKANFANKTIEENLEDKENFIIPEGKERAVIIKQRINQSFFRTAVLSSYNGKCSITGLSCLDLLEACHIVDWSENTKNRLNPSNGICLNTLFHKAYDKNYLGISPDYVIFISPRLFDENKNQNNILNFFKQYHKAKINLPDKFLPNKDLLDIHFQMFNR